MLSSLPPSWLSHTPQVALSCTCFVPQFTPSEEALMQVGGGPFLGLGFRSDWGNLPRTPFPGTSLASGGSQPRRESTYKGLSTPVQSMEKQVRGPTCSIQKGSGVFREDEAAGATSTWGCRHQPGAPGGPRASARSPPGSCGSVWSTCAGGPRAGPPGPPGRPRPPAAAGSAGRA